MWNRSKTKIQLCLCPTHFPSLGPCYQHILRVLIGVLGYLYLLWLVRFIWKVLKALASNTNISLTVQWPYLWFYNSPALTSLTSPGARVMHGVLGFFQLPKMRFRAVMYTLYSVFQRLVSGKDQVSNLESQITDHTDYNAPHPFTLLMSSAWWNEGANCKWCGQ